MNAIDFVVRTSAGAIQRDVVQPDADSALVPVAPGSEVSFNLSQSDLRGYTRVGDDLHIELADGRVVVLQSYFTSADEPRLFISSNGDLHEVFFAEGANGVLFAEYGKSAEWGKWSPDDALIHIGDPEVASVEAYGTGDNDVGMLATGLLGGGPLLGLLGLAGATAAGAAVIGSDDDDNGSDEVTDGETDEGTDGETDEGTDGETDEGTDGETDEGTDGETDEGTDGETDEGTDGETDEGTDGETDEGTDGETDEGTDGETDEGTDGETDEGTDGETDEGTDGETDEGTDGETDEGTDGETDEGTDGETDEGTDGETDEGTDGGTGDETGEGTGDTTCGTWTSPTVDDTAVVIGGDGATRQINVTGTGEPGAAVTVTIGASVVATVVDAQGTWTATFDGGDFPADGHYVATVAVELDTGDTTFTAALTGPEVTIDLTGPELDVTSGTAETGDLVNLVAHAGGLTVTGTGEAGASVDVTIDGVTKQTVVSQDGTWSVDYASGEIATGEYTTDVSVVSADSYGNTTTLAQTLVVDTIPNDITINTAAIGGDGVVNGLEADGALTVSGTATPGATLDVTVAGVVTTVTADQGGNWSFDLPAGSFEDGVYDAEITATSTDAAGNSSSTSGTIHVDTEVSVSINDGTIETDGLVNAEERADGTEITGTAEPGASVEVEMNGVTQTTTAGDDGKWSVSYEADDIPTGEVTVPVTVTATDAEGNSTSTTGSFEVDTIVDPLDLTSTPGGADGVVNAEEASQGLILTGVVEPGSSLIVTLDGVSHPATVAEDGTWTATFAPDELPSGEVDVTLDMVATDAAGNTRSESETVTFDTDAGTLTISPDPIEGDDVINDVEASDGVVIHGTSDPGAVVTVTLGGVVHTAVTDSAGNWTTTYADSEIAPGTYEAQITAQKTDAAGNTIEVSDSVMVDTVVDNFTFLDITTGTDEIVNAAEAGEGVTVTGTTEPGATVSVTIEGVTRTATVDAEGNWSAEFESGTLPEGEYQTTLTIDTTDAAGNTAQITRTAEVDTLVNTLTVTETSAGADDVVNWSELQAGGALTLSGQVEPGSTVSVEFNGTAYTATVAASGAWAVDIPAEDVPPGEYDAEFEVTATDRAGNTAETTETLHIDTQAPDGPIIESITQDITGIRGISTDLSDASQDVIEVTEVGSIDDVPMTIVDVPAIGETNFFFTQTVPDGSDLIVTSSDDAGNSSSTYLVLDDEVPGTEVSLDNPGLGDHNVEAVDLEFAEEAHLTLTEADILALSDATDTLTVLGDSDDQVTIEGATLVGTTTNGSGQSFAEYQLGDATVLIDEDITNVVI